MYSNIRSFAFCALWATSALAAPSVERAAFVRCGTNDPPAALVQQAQQLAVKPEPQAAALATLTVNAYFHVVESTTKRGSVTQAQLNNQLTVLNRSYGPSGITFTLVSSDFTVNDQWATGNYDAQMKPALRKGTYKDLNVYFLSDLGGGLLGICNFPTNASPGSSTYNQDGCDVLAQSVPGGTAAPFNLGGTATHEIGHWFGLFHVFQGSACTGNGDSVSDTPIQKTPTSGCPASKDSCPSAAGLDDIHNYMDYSDDSCYTRFTSGQATRMQQMYSMYRAGK
ncbi:MAG: hypothetical protein L6R38_005717 [Xanthoria sp. 2 TBL-2021]|nr:MAG: hypothetical protein L6R38_005717 [Xanthoria sp. 2 TBL-2021]